MLGQPSSLSSSSLQCHMLPSDGENLTSVRLLFHSTLPHPQMLLYIGVPHIAQFCVRLYIETSTKTTVHIEMCAARSWLHSYAETIVISSGNATSYLTTAYSRT